MQRDEMLALVSKKKSEIESAESFLKTANQNPDVETLNNLVSTFNSANLRELKELWKRFSESNELQFEQEFDQLDELVLDDEMMEEYFAKMKNIAKELSAIKAKIKPADTNVLNIPSMFLFDEEIDVSSESDEEIDEEIQKAIDEFNDDLAVLKNYLRTAGNELAKLTDNYKKDQFYVQFVASKTMKKYFEEYGLEKVRSNLDSSDDELGLDPKYLNQAMIAAEKLSQIKIESNLAEVRLLAYKIEHASPEVKFVPNFLDAADVDSIPKQEESVANINRLFSRLRQERENNELAQKDMNESSQDFGMSIQL